MRAGPSVRNICLNEWACCIVPSANEGKKQRGSSMDEKKRWKEMDILRGWAILMVLLYHSIIVFPLNLHEIQWCKTLHTFLWTVQMPLFFSGVRFLLFFPWKLQRICTAQVQTHTRSSYCIFGTGYFAKADSQSPCSWADGHRGSSSGFCILWWQRLVLMDLICDRYGLSTAGEAFYRQFENEKGRYPACYSVLFGETIYDGFSAAQHGMSVSALFFLWFWTAAQSG